jgi:hypothetical protein
MPEPAPQETLVIERPAPAQQGKQRDPARFWTIGISGGSAFTVPWVIGTVHATLAPIRYMFLEIGCDIGLLALDDRVDSYYSLYPYANFAAFVPFGGRGGFFIGAGAGYMMAHYSFPEGEHPPINMLAFNGVIGVNLGNFFNISYTLRTDFNRVSNKASVGFTYRF